MTPPIIPLVSAADIAKAAEQSLPSVREWLERTGRSALAQHNGELLYPATAAQALLDERLGALSILDTASLPQRKGRK